MMNNNDKEYKQLKFCFDVTESSLNKPEEIHELHTSNIVYLPKRTKETFRQRVIKDLLKSRAIID